MHVSDIIYPCNYESVPEHLNIRHLVYIHSVGTPKRVLVRVSSVVMTTKLALLSRWLVTTEPTPPSQCFAVLLVVFVGAVF